MTRGFDSVLDSMRSLGVAGAALVRADGEAFEADGPIDREEAIWIARALVGTVHGTFELVAGKRVQRVDAYEVAPGTALILLRDGDCSPNELAIDELLGALRKSGSRAGHAGVGAMQARRR